jgi:TetR/AcrR family transcriptional repressor of nem operon
MNDRAQRRGETHQRIIEAAGRLFREHGIDGVGVDAIMREAGLTHGGFYAHFPSKEAMVAEVSRAMLEKSADRWTEFSTAQVSTPADKAAALRRIVEPYLSPEHVQSGHGCLLTTLSTEAARRSAVRHAMDAPLHDMLAALERCLPDATQAPVALATMVGAVTLARLADDPALAERFLQAAAQTVLPADDPASPEPDA